MRSFLLATAVTGVLAVPALAQPPEGKGDGDRPRSREEMREHFKARILNAFDKDGDGKLSDDERKNLPEGARDRAIAILDGKGGEKKDGEKGDRKKDGEKAEKKKGEDKKKADGKDARRKQGQRGPSGRGPRGGPQGDRRHMEMHRVRQMHAGPGRPSGEFRKFMADALFKKFDADGDEKLSREEFNKLGQFVHEHVPHPGSERGHHVMATYGRGHDGPPGPPRGGRGEGMRRRGPGPGDPPRGDREVRRDGPPRGDGSPPERRMRRPDGDGPRDADRGDRGPRGPRGDGSRGDGPRRGPRPGGPRPDGPGPDGPDGPQAGGPRPEGPPGPPPGSEDKPDEPA